MLKKFQLLTSFACTSPPANITQQLDEVRDTYSDAVKQLQSKRAEQYREVLAQLAKHPDVMPVGTKFIRWHRQHIKRIELEVVEVTVRPVFECWDLAYKCKSLSGEEVTIYAGSMKEVASA